ncbi:hypothetical protein DA83_25555 [Pseudomonas sp. 250J]|nr:hypothetical protein DA83_25555 [Pseudomonas sp. 250J]
MRQLFHRATQCRAQFGQGVFDGGRHGRVYLAFHPAVALELLQGLRQHLLLDTGDFTAPLCVLSAMLQRRMGECKYISYRV